MAIDIHTKIGTGGSSPRKRRCSDHIEATLRELKDFSGGDTGRRASDTIDERTFITSKTPKR